MATQPTNQTSKQKSGVKYITPNNTSAGGKISTLDKNKNTKEYNSINHKIKSYIARMNEIKSGTIDSIGIIDKKYIEVTGRLKKFIEHNKNFRNEKATVVNVFSEIPKKIKSFSDKLHKLLSSSIKENEEFRQIVADMREEMVDTDNGFEFLEKTTVEIKNLLEQFDNLSATLDRINAAFETDIKMLKTMKK